MRVGGRDGIGGKIIVIVIVLETWIVACCCEVYGGQGRGESYGRGTLAAEEIGRLSDDVIGGDLHCYFAFNSVLN